MFSVAAWSGQLGFNGNYSFGEQYDHCIIGMNAIVRHGVDITDSEKGDPRNSDS